MPSPCVTACADYAVTSLILRCRQSGEPFLKTKKPPPVRAGLSSTWSGLYQRPTLGIAALDEEIVRELTKRSERVVEYWLSRMTNQEDRLVAADRIPIFVEVLARLAVRGGIDEPT